MKEDRGPAVTKLQVSGRKKNTRLKTYGNTQRASVNKELVVQHKTIRLLLLLIVLRELSFNAEVLVNFDLHISVSIVAAATLLTIVKK